MKTIIIIGIVIIGIVIICIIGTVVVFASMPSDTWKDYRTEFTGVSNPDELDEKINCLSRGGIWEHTSCNIENSISSNVNAEWTTSEDYCQEWCDNEELDKMGCDQPILAHLAKYSNLLDEKFNDKYEMMDRGLSDGISVEKFNECVDFIYEKRISYEFDKTWGGPGNRYPGFLGWDIPDICTQDMVKFLKKNSNMFDNNLPYASPLDGDVTGFGINPDDIVQCENELLDNRDNEPSWPDN